MKKHLSFATLSIAFSIALGAFAAHGLKKITTSENIDIFKTAVFYQLIHSVVLLFSPLLFKQVSIVNIQIFNKFIWAGIFCFSISLYIIVLLNIYKTTIPKWIGIITPIGGLFFIIGWLYLSFKFLKFKSYQD